jgi:hypothetical protein
MFSLDVVSTDNFLDMPASTQALYFHLGMRADDDGFVSSPRKITALANCSNDDLKLLITKGYIIPFESGICVVRDWKINNNVRADRYKPTIYQQEKSLFLNGSTVGMTNGIPNVIPNDIPTVSTGKVRLGKDSIGKVSKDDTATPEALPTRTKFICPTLEDVTEYVKERNSNVDPQRFIDYYTSNGWMVGKNKMKDWKAAVRNWERRDSNGNKQDNSNLWSGNKNTSIPGIQVL